MTGKTRRRPSKRFAAVETYDEFARWAEGFGAWKFGVLWGVFTTSLESATRLVRTL